MKRNCNLHRITQTNHFNEKKETFQRYTHKIEMFQQGDIPYPWLFDGTALLNVTMTRMITMPIQ